MIYQRAEITLDQRRAQERSFSRTGLKNRPQNVEFYNVKRQSWVSYGALVIMGILTFAARPGHAGLNSTPPDAVREELDTEVSNLDDSDAGMMAQAEQLEMNNVKVQPRPPINPADAAAVDSKDVFDGVGPDHPPPGSSPTLGSSPASQMSVQTQKIAPPVSHGVFMLNLLGPKHRSTYSDDGFITFEWKNPVEEASLAADAAAAKSGKHRKKKKTKPATYKLVIETLDGKTKLERKTKSHKRLMALNPGVYKWRVEIDGAHGESRWRLLKIMGLKSKSITTLYDGKAPGHSGLKAPSPRGPSSVSGAAQTGSPLANMQTTNPMEMNEAALNPNTNAELETLAPEEAELRPLKQPASQDHPSPSQNTTRTAMNPIKSQLRNPASAAPTTVTPTSMTPAATAPHITRHVAPTAAPVFHPRTKLEQALEAGLGAD